MKSNNPIFARSEEFDGTGSNAYGNQTYAGGGQSYPAYGQTTTTQSPVRRDRPVAVGHRHRPRHQRPRGRRRTDDVDSVVQKTAVTLFVVIAPAAADVVLDR